MILENYPLVDVLGHTINCDEILFMYKGKYLTCNFNLPNKFLVLELEVSPYDIDKYFKYGIQEKACAGGKWKKLYKFEDGSVESFPIKTTQIHVEFCMPKKTIFGTPFWERVTNE